MKDYNIILINLDGLRKDSVELCPTLNFFKNESYYFSNMFSVAPYTFAALHAVFSGMYPSRNGMNAYYNMFKFKKDEIVTLPQSLQRYGYYTSCDIISKVVIPNQGFNELNIYLGKELRLEFNLKYGMSAIETAASFFNLKIAYILFLIQ